MIQQPSLPPPALPGDRVGIAALSGPVRASRLRRGVRALRQLGFEPVEASNLRVRKGLFAGDEPTRLAAFYELVTDPEVRVIFFARGGYGVHRLLDRLDWELLARHPKAYVGYSDLTPFLLQVVTRLGWVAFHGPMVAADLARGLLTMESRSLLEALAGSYPTAIPLGPCRGEEATEGPILGGCLSLLTSLLGTPFAPDLESALLFVEDLNEPAYRLDRMLTHLRLSGNLQHLKGLMVGHLVSGGEGGRKSPGAETPLRARVRDLADSFEWPLAFGLRTGHASPNLTVPLGLRGRLDPLRRRLEIFGAPQLGRDHRG